MTILVEDELIPHLPPPPPGEPEWEMTAAPDQEVLAGGDSYRFVPSEGTTPGYVEFDFLAVDSGTTTFTIARGPADAPVESFTLTVEVKSR